MLPLHSTDEFAEWFDRLGDADAEEVATALELVEKLGPDTPSPASRESLLWYQSAAAGRALVSEELVDFMLSSMQLVSHLESRAVQGRLGKLSREQSADASRAFAGTHAGIRRVLVMARLAELNEVDRALTEMQRQYSDLLASIGAPESPAASHSQALRELNLRARKPGMRILYGVDVPRGRALLVLGEHLDRNAYGPAVRRALAVWQRYLSDEKALPLRPTPGTGSF